MPVEIEGMLHSRKTRYVILDEILRRAVPSGTDCITFLIDVRSVLRPLYQPAALEALASLSGEDRRMIAAELLNLAAHFRHYCWTRLTAYSTFYFFYSTRECRRARAIDPDYRRDFYAKYLVGSADPSLAAAASVVSRNLRMARTISEYVPNVHFVDTEDVEPNLAAAHFSLGAPSPVVFTTDRVLYQLALPPWRALVLTIQGDDSECFGADGLVARLLKEEKVKTEYLVPSDHYPWALSLAGYERYSLRGVGGVGPTKALGLLSQMAAKGAIGLAPVEDEDEFAIACESSGLLSRERAGVAANNHRLLFLRGAYDDLTEAEKLSSFDEKVVERVDGRGLRAINDRYFERHPIKLIELFEGEAGE